MHEALRAVTIGAAHSWRLEHELLGSITPGKAATFTVLAEDPYQVDPARLADIPILGTVYEGRWVLGRLVTSHRINPSRQIADEDSGHGEDEDGTGHRQEAAFESHRRVLSPGLQHPGSANGAGQHGGDGGVGHEVDDIDPSRGSSPREARTR